MAPLSPELVESEDENAMKVDKVEKNPNNDEPEGGEDEGTEYEIEEIMDAKRGAFPEGRMGYLVKWKGYGEEENSWVDELDTENAKELVAEFWKKNPKKKPRKSVEPKAKRTRKSSVADDIEESDVGSVVQKRGRKSTQKMGSDEDEDDLVRNRRTKKGEKPPKVQKALEDSQTRLHDMTKYMDKENWEDLVDTIDTVERTEDGLVIYFTLKNGEHIRDNAAICRQRFPQKLLSFYESNLKWRAAESNVEE